MLSDSRIIDEKVVQAILLNKKQKKAIDIADSEENAMTNIGNDYLDIKKEVVGKKKRGRASNKYNWALNPDGGKVETRFNP